MWRWTYHKLFEAVIDAEVLAGEAFEIESRGFIARLDRKRQKRANPQIVVTSQASPCRGFDYTQRPALRRGWHDTILPDDYAW
jgi:hypothetical protein